MCSASAAAKASPSVLSVQQWSQLICGCNKAHTQNKMHKQLHMQARTHAHTQRRCFCNWTFSSVTLEISTRSKQSAYCRILLSKMVWINYVNSPSVSPQDAISEAREFLAKKLGFRHFVQENHPWQCFGLTEIPVKDLRQAGGQQLVRDAAAKRASNQGHHHRQVLPLLLPARCLHTTYHTAPKIAALTC